MHITWGCFRTACSGRATIGGDGGRRAARMALVVGAAACVAGCSSDTGVEVVPVSGMVSLDGEPVFGATVLFSPAAGGRSGFAETDAGGKFVGQTEVGGKKVKGLVPGEYRVAVVKFVDDNPPPLAAPEPPGLGPDGAPPSREALAKFEAEMAALRSAPPRKPLRSLVPAPYRDTRSSPLAITVARPAADVHFQLDSKKP